MLAFTLALLCAGVAALPGSADKPCSGEEIANCCDSGKGKLKNKCSPGTCQTPALDVRGANQRRV
ncbi:hypothetical protein ISF_07877 [Cordyceps fumosorosea ARSEF 2679]|uniref:Uncharacterized protein n=1 Tax=Cordyceps fumosorosea (strain ARSEF 2679) TaxID=1081104 RepID=A0A167NBQ2_CORFA|nr:hypothetical protein ISF_07877 [Cordyceps fumosorosea ARSEF 2679]OAA55366.1 hypothetical protein ISF_07877 [Cordyceps fumosorosea ARSEF 2679]